MKKLLAFTAVVGSPLVLALPSMAPGFGVLLVILNLWVFEQTQQVFYTLLTVTTGVFAAAGSVFFLSL